MLHTDSPKMTDFTKSYGSMDCKLKSLDFWITRSRSKYNAEIQMFKVHKRLYENNKTQLAEMLASTSDIDKQLYFLLSTETDENRKKARLHQANYRAQRKTIEDLESLIRQLKAPNSENAKHSKVNLDNYEALLDLCILQEEDIMCLGEKRKEVEKELGLLTDMQHEARTAKEVEYFGKRIRGAKWRIKRLDQKFRDTTNISLSHKQEFIDNSVALISQWVRGNTTGAIHVISLWDRCLQNSVQTTDTSMCAIISELMKDNMDLLQIHPHLGHSPLEPVNVPVSGKMGTRDWLEWQDASTRSGDKTMSIGELGDFRDYKTCSKRETQKNNKAPNLITKKFGNRTRIHNAKPRVY
ncbi:hypothetical protein ScPMuIL_010001 [Solemya velum]